MNSRVENCGIGANPEGHAKAIRRIGLIGPAPSPRAMLRILQSFLSSSRKIFRKARIVIPLNAKQKYTE